MDLLRDAIERFGAKPLAEELRVKPDQIYVWRSRKKLSKPRRAMIEALLTTAPKQLPLEPPVAQVLRDEAIAAAIRELGEKIDAGFRDLKNLVEATRMSFDRQRGERLKPRAGPLPGTGAPGP